MTAFAQAPAPGIDFSIAPQPLSSALIEFAKQANVQVLTAGSNLENSRTRGVSISNCNYVDRAARCAGHIRASGRNADGIGYRNRAN